MKKLRTPDEAETRRIDKGIAADPDAFEPTDAEFETARRGRPKLPDEARKVSVTVRLAPEVVEHFKSGGRGWQTRLNDVLADYVARESGPVRRAG